MKEKNPIDELFKQGLENKEIKPSDAAWSKIEEAMMPEDSKKGGFYFMRAAVVTLLVGLSSWVYISNNPLDFGTDNPIPPTSIDINGLDNTVAGSGDPVKGASTKSSTKSTTGKDPKASSVKKKERKIVPILRSSGSPLVKLVSIETTISPAIEDLRMMDHEMFVTPALITEDENKQKTQTIGSPVTEKTYYADKGETEEEKPVKKLKFKERVFAYASDQFNNLISGEPLELPKTELNGTPKLEISLGNFLTKE